MPTRPANRTAGGLSPGERLVASLPLKRSFYDAHERRAYLRSAEVAKRIVDDPSLLESGRQYLERFVAPDPHQGAAYQCWRQMLELPPEQIARRLLEDSEEGGALRDTAPVFVVIPRETLLRLWRTDAG